MRNENRGCCLTLVLQLHERIKNPAFFSQETAVSASLAFFGLESPVSASLILQLHKRIKNPVFFSQETTFSASLSFFSQEMPVDLPVLSRSSASQES
ncbi:hypothetical protein ACLOJK_011180, partial [Asimina triloba]